jgi:uncharacterized membrane protein
MVHYRMRLICFPPRVPSLRLLPCESLTPERAPPSPPPQRFAALSMEERGKFQNETLSNVDSIKRAGGMAAETAAGVTNEYIVVTLLVACDGLLRVRLSLVSRSCSMAFTQPACLAYVSGLHARRVPAWFAQAGL